MMAVSPYITREMLTMLWHTYDTNLNKAMNRSVSSFAPKDRTFSRSMSLTTRVSIAARVQLVGHYKYWEMMLERQGIKMSSALETLLREKDKNSEHRREYRRRPDVKRRENKGDTEKISKGIEETKGKIKKVRTAVGLPRS